MQIILKKTLKKKKDFLTNYIPKTSNFYQLPKIPNSKEFSLKAVEIQTFEYIEISNTSNLKLRTIVAV